MENLRRKHVNRNFLHVCRFDFTMDRLLSSRLEASVLRDFGPLAFGHHHTLDGTRVGKVRYRPFSIVDEERVASKVT